MIGIRPNLSAALDQPPRRDLAVALALCLVLLLSSLLVGKPGIGYDGDQYLVYARNLLATGQFTFDGVNASCGRAPGYPLVLALILLTTKGIAILYPLQLLLLLASYWCVYRVVAPLAPGRWGLGLLITLAALWPLHSLAMDVIAEPLFMAITCGSLLLLVRGLQRQSSWFLFFASLVMGISALVRPVNVFASIIIAAFCLWRGHLNWRRALLFAVVAWLPLLPWTWRNARQFGQFVPVAAHVGSFYYMTDAEVFWPVLLHSAGYTHSLPIHKQIVGSDLELDFAANQRYWQRGMANIRHDPLGFLKRCVLKTVFVWSYLPGTKKWVFTAPWLFAAGVVVQWTFLLAAWMGWRLFRKAQTAAADAVISYPLYTILALFPFYAESRFLLPVYIWLFGFAWIWLSSKLLKSQRVP
ncbi:MAG: hypothetical protein HZB43_12510 [candidate division Zixibacteria bacterium]|nr:hypothetical protein [candidate division Zixibacteria bacterium]